MSTIESLFTAHVAGSDRFDFINALYGNRPKAEVLRNIQLLMYLLDDKFSVSHLYSALATSCHHVCDAVTFMLSKNGPDSFEK